MLFTCYKNASSPASFKELRLDAVANDANPFVQARNALFLQLLLDGVEIAKSGDATSFKMHVASVECVVQPDHSERLHKGELTTVRLFRSMCLFCQTVFIEATKRLHTAAASPDAWAASPLAALLSCDDSTLAEMHRVFAFWLEALDKKLLNIETTLKARTTILESKLGRATDESVSVRQPNFVGLLALSLEQKQFGAMLAESMNDEGVCLDPLSVLNLPASASSQAPERWVNPTMFEGSAEYSLHYGSDPRDAFVQHQPPEQKPRFVRKSAFDFVEADGRSAKGSPKSDSKAKHRVRLLASCIEQFGRLVRSTVDAIAEKRLHVSLHIADALSATHCKPRVRSFISTAAALSLCLCLCLRRLTSLTQATWLITSGCFPFSSAHLLCSTVATLARCSALIRCCTSQTSSISSCRSSSFLTCSPFASRIWTRCLHRSIRWPFPSALIRQTRSCRK